MNVDVPLADSRRIERANGLPLVDATFVSPVGRDGTARAGADRMPGTAPTDTARRKHQATVSGAFSRPWVSLVVLAVEVGGRVGTAMADFPLPKRVRRRRGFGLQPDGRRGHRRAASTHLVTL